MGCANDNQVSTKELKKLDSSIHFPTGTIDRSTSVSEATIQL